MCENDRATGAGAGCVPGRPHGVPLRLRPDEGGRLPSGTLYPLLARLEHQKLVTSAWETPQQEGQRPRKYYKMTGEGIRIARLELAHASARRQRAPARPGHPAPGSLG